jgi:hypothetical protein
MTTRLNNSDAFERVEASIVQSDEAMEMLARARARVHKVSDMTPEERELVLALIDARDAASPERAK